MKKQNDKKKRLRKMRGLRASSCITDRDRKETSAKCTCSLRSLIMRLIVAVHPSVN